MKSVVIVAGGSGGHIVPALAVARELYKRGAMRIFWLGSRRMQNRILDNEEFPVYQILLKPWRGGSMLRKLMYLLFFPISFAQTFIILMRVRASAIFSTGGYAIFPAALVAALFNLPIFLQEQNARWSLSSRLLLPLTKRVYTAYPDIGVKDRLAPKIRCLGNPLLASSMSMDGESPKQRYAKRQGALRVFITGGSQGALALNELVPAALKGLPNWEIRHQCGKGWLQKTVANYDRVGLQAEVQEFIKDMRSLFLWADLVVARAGAMTLQEIVTAGVASLLIPFPYATDNHQWFNAHYLVKHQAAFLMLQNDAPLELPRMFASLTHKRKAKESRARLVQMAESAYRLRTPYATRDIANDITKVLQCA